MTYVSPLIPAIIDQDDHFYDSSRLIHILRSVHTQLQHSSSSSG